MRLKNKKILTSLLVSPSLLIPFSVISTTTSADSDAPKLELFKTKSAEEIAKMEFFDAREYNLVTNVKHQGHEGLCWAYTIASILETNMLKNNIGNYTKNSLDIDEHAIDYISNSWNHNADKLNLNPDAKEWKGILGEGNYLSHAFNGLMRNTSPIAQTNQNEFPNFDNPTIAKIKNAVKINHTVDDIKLAIAKYGSVGVAYAFNGMNFGSKTVWYNEPNSIIETKSLEERKIKNHASVIVGWDDTYYQSNFEPERPKQRGGFIIKNSWGTKMHGEGYFMLSYDSLDLIHEVMAVEVESNNTYQNTYYYDTKNSFSLFATIDTNERTMANIFPVKKANDEIVEKLKSINFSLKGSNITAEIKIYVKNSSMSNPEDGELKLTQKVEIPNSGDKGFYTIDLNEEIILSKGQYFSIIVDVTNKAEQNVDLMVSEETREILSFYKYNNQWVNSKKNFVVFRIKAHTLEVPINELNKGTAVNEENKELEESSETNTNNNPSESDTENNPPRSDHSESESQSSESDVETDTVTNIEESSDSEISREEEISSPKTNESGTETDSASQDNNKPTTEDSATENKDAANENPTRDQSNSNPETEEDQINDSSTSESQPNNPVETWEQANSNPTTNESSTIEKNNSNNEKELEESSQTNTNNNPSESDAENNPPRSDDSEIEVETDTVTNIEESSDSEIPREEEINSPKTNESGTDSSSEQNNPISKESDASNVEDNSSPIAEDTTKNKDITDESSSEDETNSSSGTETDSASQDNNKPTTEDSATENKDPATENTTRDQSNSNPETEEDQINDSSTSESQPNDPVETGDQANSNPTTNESSTIEKNNSNNEKELEDVSIESKKSKTNKIYVILWSILGVLTGIITFGIATFYIVKLMKKRVKK